MTWLYLGGALGGYVALARDPEMNDLTRTVRLLIALLWPVTLVALLAEKLVAGMEWLADRVLDLDDWIKRRTA